jgi:holliday junction DNA helicase RuvA
VIASLRGTLLIKEPGRVVVEAGGVGYELCVTASAFAQLPPVGQEAFLLVAESFGMYGGGQTLYGFTSESEKAMFSTFKDEVPSTGAKKALEYLDKASKSLPDFRRAVLDRDAKLLCGVFGFTKKTAERLIDALKDKLDGVPAAGIERIARRDAPELPPTALSHALAALSALGYKPAEARAALSSVAEDSASSGLEAEQLVRLALKKL